MSRFFALSREIRHAGALLNRPRGLGVDGSTVCAGLTQDIPPQAFRPPSRPAAKSRYSDNRYGYTQLSVNQFISALDAFQYALSVTQNNIGNASTPGYAKQEAVLQADPFDPAGGLSGGVSNGQMVDSRDLLAERDVWQQSAAQGDAAAQNEALSEVQNALPTSSGSGIPAALTTFFNDASAWNASPNDGSIRQTVINDAAAVVQSFHTTAATVANVAESTNQSITSTVTGSNQLSSELSSLNVSVQRGGQRRCRDSSSDLQYASVSLRPGEYYRTTAAGWNRDRVAHGRCSAGGRAPLLRPERGAGGRAYQPTGRYRRATDYDDTGVGWLQRYQSDQFRNSARTAPGQQCHDSQPDWRRQPGRFIKSDGAILRRASEPDHRPRLRVPGVPASGGLFVTDPNHPASAAANLAVDPNMTAGSCRPSIKRHL